jgi:Domain of unknown function (DUF4440)
VSRAWMRALAAWSVALLLGACASSPAANDGEQVAAVQRFLSDWNAALAAGDRQAVRAAYSNSPDFRWHEDGVLRYRSADEVLAALDQFPPGTRLSTTLSDITVLPLGNEKYNVSAAFKTRIGMPNGAFEFGGVFTAVLERKGSNFAFLTGHTSSVRANSGRN